MPDFYEDHPKVRPVARKLTELRGEAERAERELRALEDDRQAAVNADRQAVADALRAGKPAPDETRIAAADTAIAAARRRVEALQIAVSDQAATLAASVDRHRDAWLGDVEQRIARGHTDLAGAIETVAAARGSLADLYTLRSWLRGKNATSAPRFLSHIDGLQTLAGEPMPWPIVEQALRALAAPPDERAPTGPPAETAPSAAAAA